MSHRSIVCQWMSRFLPCFAAWLVWSGAAAAAEETLPARLEAVVRRHCPAAVVVSEGGGLTARHATMRFTVHPRLMTGEYAPETQRCEGPNDRGFLLSVQREVGHPVRQADLPQELQGPYFATFLHDIPTEDGRGCYCISFAYGSRVDARLKADLLRCLGFPPGKIAPAR